MPLFNLLGVFDINSQNVHLINTSEVKPFIVNESYSSKMLLDEFVAGEATVHINEGTLKGGSSTGLSAHKANEIYYVTKGEAILHIDGQDHDISPGSLVYIPADVYHGLTNKSRKNIFVLLTIWQNTEGNDVYDQRVKAWGKSFKTIHED